MFYKLFTALLTICFSSFTNLCAQRFGSGQTPWSPARSYCDHCHHSLTWWQLIPIAGFVIQRGRCIFCHQPIGSYNTICELVSGLAACLLATTSLIHNVLIIIVLQTLLFILTSDLLYQYLYPLSLLGLLPLIYLLPTWEPPEFYQLITDILFLILLAIMATKQLLGGGDILYIGGLLLIFGPVQTAMVLLAACIVIIPFFFISSQSRLPFLPPLVLATLLILLLICH